MDIDDSDAVVEDENGKKMFKTEELSNSPAAGRNDKAFLDSLLFVLSILLAFLIGYLTGVLT